MKKFQFGVNIVLIGLFIVTITYLFSQRFSFRLVSLENKLNTVNNSSKQVINLLEKVDSINKNLKNLELYVDNELKILKDKLENRLEPIITHDGNAVIKEQNNDSTAIEKSDTLKLLMSKIYYKSALNWNVEKLKEVISEHLNIQLPNDNVIDEKLSIILTKQLPKLHSLQKKQNEEVSLIKNQLDAEGKYQELTDQDLKDGKKYTYNKNIPTKIVMSSGSKRRYYLTEDEYPHLFDITEYNKIIEEILAESLKVLFEGQ
jgi:hypothetical protein